MSKNTGKPSEAIFEEHWGAEGKVAFCHRITDASEVRGRSKGFVVVKKQPSDYLVVDRGRTYFAEVKSTNDPVGFKKNLLRTSQSSFATMIEAAGGEYFYFIHSIALDKWWMVRAKDLVRAASWDRMPGLPWYPKKSIGKRK